MSIMSVVVIFVCMTITFFASLFCIGVSFNLVEVNISIPFLQRQIASSQLSSDLFLRFSLGLIGLLLIILCLRYLYSLFFPSQRGKSITFESPQGKIDITLFALEDMIKKLLERRRELAHIRPRVFFRKKTIDITVSSYLAADVNLLEFTQEIQQEIRKKLVSFLGDDNIINVKISIRKVLFGRRGEQSEPVEKEPEIPFRMY